MRLRGKLLLAEAPMVLALVAIAIAGAMLVSRLGQGANAILEDNYRSVLAAQRMEAALARLDRGALFVVAGERARAKGEMAGQRQRFEEELEAQEENITEPGEREATVALRASWAAFGRALDGLLSEEEPGRLAASYFERLEPRLDGTDRAAQDVLEINQDAMLRKSDLARRLANRSIGWLTAIALAGSLLSVFASAALTERVLRPLSVLGQAARRIGEGDLAARAVIEGEDEIARLARELNTMAERLQKYRQSSLGELLEAQRASQATIDSLPDPVLVVGLGGELLQANRAAGEALKVDVERGGIGVLDPAIRELVEKAIQHVAAGRGAYAPGVDQAARLVTSEGERYLLPRASPVEADEGGISATTVVLQDVTRLLRFEELRNDLVATVAHELRTPLTSLRMSVHLLVERVAPELDEKLADLVFAAREDCERLQSIVDELLDLSRIQAGRIELRRSAVAAEALVDRAAEAARAAAAERNIRLESEALPGIGEAFVDPERVQLVFSNLIGNALRASSEGGVVTVRAVAARDRVRFEVQDGGPGVPPEYRQAIFEKYFRVPGAASGSAGLGLFICREIVQAHGGEIGVESEPGKGSTFWFELPAAAVE